MQKMKEIAEQMERERDDEICLKFEPYIKKTQVKRRQMFLTMDIDLATTNL